MEAKKSQSVATKSGRKSLLGGLGAVKAEFKKISWTSREELKAYTKIVVASILVVGIGIYVVDLVIQTALSSLSSLVQAIAG